MSLQVKRFWVKVESGLTRASPLSRWIRTCHIESANWQDSFLFIFLASLCSLNHLDGCFNFLVIFQL